MPIPEKLFWRKFDTVRPRRWPRSPSAHLRFRRFFLSNAAKGSGRGRSHLVQDQDCREDDLGAQTHFPRWLLLFDHFCGLEHYPATATMDILSFYGDCVYMSPLGCCSRWSWYEHLFQQNLCRLRRCGPRKLWASTTFGARFLIASSWNCFHLGISTQMILSLIMGCREREAFQPR